MPAIWKENECYLGENLHSFIYSFSSIGKLGHSKCSINPWLLIKQFSMELLVEQVITSAAPMPLSPGDGFRRIFESIAGWLCMVIEI